MKLELVDGWKKFYAMTSIWAFAIIGLAPDIYNLAVEFHIVDSGTAPAFLARLINVLAFAGAVSRLVRQQVVTAAAEADREKREAIQAAQDNPGLTG